MPKLISGIIFLLIFITNDNYKIAAIILAILVIIDSIIDLRIKKTEKDIEELNKIIEK